MNSKIETNGKELIENAEAVLGKKFEFEEWISVLFDACRRSEDTRLFEDLAFHAKSFQKLYRLMNSSKADSSEKSGVASELKGSLTRFSHMLEKAIDYLPPESSGAFRQQFLTPSNGAFENMRKLIDDFGRLKDFLLIRRDKSHNR